MLRTTNIGARLDEVLNEVPRWVAQQSWFLHFTPISMLPFVSVAVSSTLAGAAAVELAVAAGVFGDGYQINGQAAGR